MPGQDDYQSQDPKLQHILERLRPEIRNKRLVEAERRREAIERLSSRPEGESERAAIARLVTWAHRSSFRRWKQRFEEQGLDGLISRRIAPDSRMPADVRRAICTLRQGDPNFDVDEIVKHVAEHYNFKTSETTVKRILRAEGLSRSPGGARRQLSVGERRLEFGGMKLVEAADEETGYSEALTRGIVAHVDGLPTPENAQPLDCGVRDECGRFLPEYNERLRKGPHDAIGPGFASVSLKQEGKDPTRFHLSHVRPRIVRRKIQALLVSPLIGSGRWDGMRTPRGDLLGELCGFPYMPSTLDLFTRELKYAGVSNTLWEIHARRWLEQTSQWGDARRAAVLYVDGTTKPIWTRLFSESTPVKGVGRVMPGLEQVAFHSGYGVPLLMVTHSGRAPLVKVVPVKLNQLEQLWGPSSVGRIVVIDAEGNSVPFFKGLENGKPGRAWVTRLRDDWVKGKKIFNRTNYQAYRDKDRVRVGVADFNDPDGGTFRMRVVEVERRSSGDVIYLGASMKLDAREWKAPELANLYFDRWPSQEANFRAINQATGSKQVHGYGKRLVDNVSVITELDELRHKVARAEEGLDRQQQAADDKAQRLRAEEQLLRRRQRRQATVERQVTSRLVPAGRPMTTSLQKLVKEQGELAKKVAKHTEKASKLRDKHKAATAQVTRTRKKLAGYASRQEVLKSRREIFTHDVELDSLFSLMKVGLCMLVTHVLKEYLGNARMEVSTFLEHVATLPARLRITPELEILTLEYNRRDPEVMGLLQSHCEEINARGLRMRSRRKLRLVVEEAPRPARDPPPGSRTGSGDRFKR